MADSSLEISVEPLRRVDLITVKGRVDSSNASELDEALKDVINDGRSNIVLNLNQVNYMSSAGLRALVSNLRECRKRGGDLRLSDPSPRVAEVLELAGLSTGASPLFLTYPDNTAAVGSF